MSAIDNLYWWNELPVHVLFRLTEFFGQAYEYVFEASTITSQGESKSLGVSNS